MTEDQRFGSREIERRPEDFVGKTVTMAGKDGGVWERVTITGLENGQLLLSGGAWVRNRFLDEVIREPVEGMVARAWPYDIARGVIHAATTAGPCDLEAETMADQIPDDYQDPYADSPDAGDDSACNCHGAWHARNQHCVDWPCPGCTHICSPEPGTEVLSALDDRV